MSNEELYTASSLAGNFPGGLYPSLYYVAIQCIIRLSFQFRLLPASLNPLGST